MQYHILPPSGRKTKGLLLRLGAILLLIFLASRSYSQDVKADRLAQLKVTLDSLSEQIPALNERSELILSNVPLHDYVYSLGKVHRVNLYIDKTENKIMTTSMVDVPLKDVLFFVCKKYNLTVDPVGSILNIVPFLAPPPPKPAPPPPRELGLTYEGHMVSFDLKEDSLSQVIRKLSQLSGERIFLTHGVDGKVSGYLPPTDFENALESLTFSNGFELEKHKKGFYIISSSSNGAASAGRDAKRGGKPSATPVKPKFGLNEYSLEIIEDSLEKLIFLRAEEASIHEIMLDIFDKVGMDYDIYETIEGTATLSLEGIPLKNVLKHLLRGTDYTYKIEDNIFLLGNKEMQELQQMKVFNVKYRPVDSLQRLMPESLKVGLQIKQSNEMNKLIVWGDPDRIRGIHDFLQEVDKPVPMVKIEMLVVDINFNKLIKTGIKAGLLQPGDTMSAVKSVLPGLNYNLDGNAINTILGATGVPGLVSAGILKSNFYLSIQALEERGNARIVTRPTLTTLNGQEASLTTGKTVNFVLETSFFNNSAVNAYNSVAQQIQKIEVNTTITVTPFISQDGMITMKVNPDFTGIDGDIQPDRPPNTQTRKFESTLRVKDGETVILGGLDQEIFTTSNSGLPLISRIPGLKWLFGSNSRKKEKSSLVIYITPTIYYN